MGLFTEALALFQEGYGWVFLLALVVYELYAPKLLDKDTALAPLVRDVPDQVEEVSKQQTEIRQDVDNVECQIEEVRDRQKVAMQVQRAQARADPQMNEQKVDEYLLQNGVKPDSFIKGSDVEGYSNWRSEDADSDEHKRRDSDGGDEVNA